MLLSLGVPTNREITYSTYLPKVDQFVVQYPRQGFTLHHYFCTLLHHNDTHDVVHGTGIVLQLRPTKITGQGRPYSIGSTPRPIDIVFTHGSRHVHNNDCVTCPKSRLRPHVSSHNFMRSKDTRAFMGIAFLNDNGSGESSPGFDRFGFFRFGGWRVCLHFLVL